MVGPGIRTAVLVPSAPGTRIPASGLLVLQYCERGGTILPYLPHTSVEVCEALEACILQYHRLRRLYADTADTADTARYCRYCRYGWVPIALYNSGCGTPQPRWNSCQKQNMHCQRHCHWPGSSDAKRRRKRVDRCVAGSPAFMCDPNQRLSNRLGAPHLTLTGVQHMPW